MWPRFYPWFEPRTVALLNTLRRVTVYDAAAPALVLKVMLAVMVLILPLMLLCNAYQYKVFSGAAEAGYGE
jgi:cytochrome bd-type quinol oxidase subunit 2